MIATLALLATLGAAPAGPVKIAAPLLETDRQARHAPGKLSFTASTAPDPADGGPMLSLAEDCEPAYTEAQLDGEAPPVHAGDVLTLYTLDSEQFVECDTWLIGLEGVNEGLLLVTHGGVEPCKKK